MMFYKRNEILPPPPPFPSLKVEAHKFRRDHEQKAEMPKAVEHPKVTEIKEKVKEEKHKLKEHLKTKTHKRTSEQIVHREEEVHQEFPQIPTYDEVVLPKVPDIEIPTPKVAVSEESKKEIESAISGLKKKEKFGFIKNLFPKKQQVPEKSNLERIKDMIPEGIQKIIKSDLDGAKRTYVEIMRLYNTLSAEEKKEVFEDINDFYSSRKNAESVNALR